MSELVDFYSRFMADYIAWCEKHPEISNNEDKLEEIFPEQYQKWMSSSKTWLKGKSPYAYFEEIHDPQVYASMFVGYIEQDMELPEPLLECILCEKERIYPIFRNMLFLDDEAHIEKDALDDVRAHIIAMIDEMQMAHPYGRYIELLLQQKEPDQLTEKLLIALEEAEDVSKIRKALMDGYPFAEGFAKACLLDLLCGFPDDGTVFSLLAEEFARDDVELAYLAKMAAKLGDERLLPYLRMAIDDAAVDYFTYTEIRHAIEKITGEILPERQFEGDPDYDRVARFYDEEDKP